jgi:hypothetical protein
MLLQNLFSKTKRMHVYNLQTKTSKHFYVCFRRIRKNIDLREGKTKKRSKNLYKVNKNENIQGKKHKANSAKYDKMKKKIEKKTGKKIDQRRKND